VFNNKVVSSPRAILSDLIQVDIFFAALDGGSLGADRTILESMVEDIKAQVPEEMVAVGVG
jgi:hypothetical protein